MNKGFNLIEEPWLPVTTLKGETENWGLREFFHRAHVARGLNEPSPLAYTTILRLLLAIAHRSVNGPKTDDDWFDLWEDRRSGFNPTVFDTYLDKWSHRFDLFDPVAPFGQVTDFAEGFAESPISRLVLEQTSGSNSTLFGHSRDDIATPVSPAEAARALLVAHQYAFAGTAGRFMQAPMVAGYAVSWEGSTLYETLVLNMVRYGKRTPPMLGIENDKPFWEDDDLNVPNKVVRGARGLTDLYTFRGRRLRLIPDNQGNVPCVLYDQGLVLDLLGEELRDPFKRYLAQKQANAKLPRNFSENRALWRDATGLIEGSNAQGAENVPPTVISDLQKQVFNWEELRGLTPGLIAAGLVNNQARISLWRMDRMTLPLTILVDDNRRIALREAIGHAENAWSDALRPASRTYATIGLERNGGSADGADVSAILTRIAIEQRFWSRIDRDFQSFVVLLNESNDIPQTLRDWKASIRRICESCFRDGSRTLQGGYWLQAQSAGSNHLYSQLVKIGIISKEGDEAA